MVGKIMKNQKILAAIFTTAFCTSAAFAQDPTVRNSAFVSRGANPPIFTQESVDKLREDGWTCPDVGEWPKWWEGGGNSVVVEWPQTDGYSDGGYCRMSGNGGYLRGYYGNEVKGDLILTIWARGEGTLQPGFIAFAKVEADSDAVTGLPPIIFPAVQLTGSEWTRYRFLLQKTPELFNGHVMIACPSGTIDFDDVDLQPATEEESSEVESEMHSR